MFSHLTLILVVNCLAEDVFSTSEMAATLAEITKIDPNFNKDKFLIECEREIIPTVLEVQLTFTVLLYCKSYCSLMIVYFATH